MVRAPISVDDEICDEIWSGRLDKDVNLLGRRRPALGISDDPAHRVAGGNWPGADELLALLQRDIGDLTRSAVDLVKRALGEGIDLHGIEVATAGRLDAGSRIREVDPLLGIGRLGC